MTAVVLHFKTYIGLPGLLRRLPYDQLVVAEPEQISLLGSSPIGRTDFLV